MGHFEKQRPAVLLPIGDTMTANVNYREAYLHDLDDI